MPQMMPINWILLFFFFLSLFFFFNIMNYYIFYQNMFSNKIVKINHKKNLNWKW